MPYEIRFTCPLPNGLHARPASLLAEVARGFAATSRLVSEISGANADARSVLGIVGLDLKKGDRCRLVVSGTDAAAAHAALLSFIETVLPACDTPLPAAPAPEHGDAYIPPGLRPLDPIYISGQPASPGVGAGHAVVIGPLRLPDELAHQRPGSASAERALLADAIETLRRDLERDLSRRSSGVERDLVRTQIAIASDPALLAAAEERIAAGSTAAQAVVAASEKIVAALRAAASPYIRERALDAQDICFRLLTRLCGGSLDAAKITLAEPSIVVADALTPSQLLALDRSLLRALVLGPIGPTSHTAILARAFRIPTLVNVPTPVIAVEPGREIVVDADSALAITHVTPAIRRYYEREFRTQDLRRRRFEPFAGRPAATRDGRRLEIAANVATAEELDPAFESGAEGIGLFRTEMLFLERPAPPDEGEQLAAYAHAARAAAGRSVIIRTFDIGGDKPAPYLDIPREDNPFLGLRGVRLYRHHPDLLRTQLRAIARASAHGPLKVMAPMVATVAEVRWFKAQLAEVQAELTAAGIPHDPAMPVGVMVEVPAATAIIDRLAREVDFFSIGTNDLSQYWFAADRGNSRVVELCSPRPPSFLRLLRTIADAARAHNRWIGICGEMARDAAHLPLMVGLGLDEISVAAPDVLPLKAALSQLDSAACRELLNAAVDCDDVSDVDRLLAGFASASGSADLLTPELVIIGSDSTTKHEAIKELADALYIAGRTEFPRRVEEAVWARETVYSTGLGHGFAIPHCKTDAVTAPSIVIARLREPLDWGAADGEPVRVVLLLAIRESDGAQTHMKILAKLARKLMHEDFRERLLHAKDGEILLACLREELELAAGPPA